MSDNFYVLLLIGLIAVPGVIFFAGWWNRRHGYDERGNPIARSPRTGQ